MNKNPFAAIELIHQSADQWEKQTSIASMPTSIEWRKTTSEHLYLRIVDCMNLTLCYLIEFDPHRFMWVSLKPY